MTLGDLRLCEERRRERESGVWSVTSGDETLWGKGRRRRERESEA